jgi:hypothetical protein
MSLKKELESARVTVVISGYIFYDINSDHSFFIKMDIYKELLNLGIIYRSLL